jgi:hypothetical protein
MPGTTFGAIVGIVDVVAGKTTLGTTVAVTFKSCFSASLLPTTKFYLT